MSVDSGTVQLLSWVVVIGLGVFFIGILAFSYRRIVSAASGRRRLGDATNPRVSWKLMSFRGVPVSYRLSMKVPPTANFRIFLAQEVNSSGSATYLPHRKVLSIGGNSFGVYADDAQFLEWIQSGQLNREVHLLFTQTPTKGLVIGVEKSGLFIRDWSWPLGHIAYLHELPYKIIEDAHLASLLERTFVELIDKAVVWRKPSQ